MLLEENVVWSAVENSAPEPWKKHEDDEHGARVSTRLHTGN